MPAYERKAIIGMGTGMASWEAASRDLNDILSGAPIIGGQGLPERIDDLAAAQIDEPIADNRGCAAALSIGLTSMGIDLDDDGVGAAVVRNALRYLRV